MDPSSNLHQNLDFSEHVTTFNIPGCPYAKGASGNVSTEDVVSSSLKCTVVNIIHGGKLLELLHGRL